MVVYYLFVFSSNRYLLFILHLVRDLLVTHFSFKYYLLQIFNRASVIRKNDCWKVFRGCNSESKAFEYEK